MQNDQTVKQKEVELYDTTLRDGAQQKGISLSVYDKLTVATTLDSIGIHFIEGGYAGANPKDDEFFKQARKLKLNNAIITAFGSTRKANTPTYKDPVLQSLLKTEASVITLVAKASDIHVLAVIQTSLEENINMVTDSIVFLRDRGLRVFLDAEHFFDGYKSNRDYALQVLNAAHQAGAERIVLCDTNGGTLPAEIHQITKQSINQLPNAVFGIHTHNDTDTAVASAIAAVNAGVFQVQGCVNGYGERTGNANIISTIANLQLKMGIKCIPPSNIVKLTDVSRFVAEKVNRNLSPFQPFVGQDAFTHKGGLHVAAIERLPQAYNHIEPSSVGNSISVTVSELAGRGNVTRKIRDMGLSQVLHNKEAYEIVQHVKTQESKGLSYELGQASLELIIIRRTPNYIAPFKLIDLNVYVNVSLNGKTEFCRANIKLEVDNTRSLTVGEGNGPVAAMDDALRKALIRFYPNIDKVKLLDYKVRVLSEGLGTSSCTQVAIESSDSKQVWNTVGASENILEASWNALADSLEWWLVNFNPKK